MPEWGKKKRSGYTLRELEPKPALGVLRIISLAVHPGGHSLVSMVTVEQVYGHERCRKR
jgi:hypothetical protein